MMKYIKIQLLLRILAVLGLVLSTACGCAAPIPPPPPTPALPPAPTEETPVVDTKPEEMQSFPFTVTDDLGRTIKIEKLPQRIVSLAPSNTEIIYALGLEDRLVGTTDYCDYPEGAKTKPRVASYIAPDMEKLVRIQPDLIIAEAVHEKTVLPALEKLGFTVIVTSAKSLDTILHDITLIGQINGKSKAASHLVANMTRRIEAVVSKTQNLTTEQRPRVLYVVWHNPIWTMGRNTFTDDLIHKAGGVNVFANDFEKSRVVSLEAVIAKNPQIIIVSGMGTTGDLIYNSIIREQRLGSVDAFVNNRIYKISDANIIERPGPRIVDGLEEVAKLIHPEIFGRQK